ncbi:hypothetical protein NODU109028_21130 [Nocardioides dubius]
MVLIRIVNQRRTDRRRRSGAPVDRRSSGGRGVAGRDQDHRLPVVGRRGRATADGRHRNDHPGAASTLRAHRDGGRAGRRRGPQVEVDLLAVDHGRSVDRRAGRVGDRDARCDRDAGRGLVGVHREGAHQGAGLLGTSGGGHRRRDRRDVVGRHGVALVDLADQVPVGGLGVGLRVGAGPVPVRVEGQVGVAPDGVLDRLDGVVLRQARHAGCGREVRQAECGVAVRDDPPHLAGNGRVRAVVVAARIVEVVRTEERGGEASDSGGVGLRRHVVLDAVGPVVRDTGVGGVGRDGAVDRMHAGPRVALGHGTDPDGLPGVHVGVSDSHHRRHQEREDRRDDERQPPPAHGQGIRLPEVAGTCWGTVPAAPNGATTYHAEPTHGVFPSVAWTTAGIWSSLRWFDDPRRRQ